MRVSTGRGLLRVSPRPCSAVGAEGHPCSPVPPVRPSSQGLGFPTCPCPAPSLLSSCTEGRMTPPLTAWRWPVRLHPTPSGPSCRRTAGRRVPGCSLVGRGTRQLSGKEMTLEPGVLWETQLRGPAGLLPPCPAPWDGHGRGAESCGLPAGPPERASVPGPCLSPGDRGSESSRDWPGLRPLMVLPGRQISVQICKTPEAQPFSSHRARGRVRGFLRAGWCGSHVSVLPGSAPLLGNHAGQAGLCSPVDTDGWELVALAPMPVSVSQPRVCLWGV